MFYSAAEFSRQLPSDLTRKRRLLHCPECEGPAFFRNASFSGRVACFGARPHAHGCRLAAYDYVRPIYGADYGQNAPHNPGGRIVVDFSYGTPVIPAHVEMTGCAPMPGRAGDYPDRTEARTRRRLSSLLRFLIESPTFANSDQIIEIEGRNGIAARDFFIPMRSVDQRYLGQFGGYWGLISDVRFSDDRRTLWFNGGGQPNFSFCLDAEFIGDLNQRFRVTDEEDLAGAFILVIGVLQISRDGKLYCVIDDVGSMALRPT